MFNIDSDEFRTSDGKAIPTKQITTIDYEKREFICKNRDNDIRHKPKAPRYWFNRHITCEDYKVQ